MSNYHIYFYFLFHKYIFLYFYFYFYFFFIKVYKLILTIYGKKRSFFFFLIKTVLLKMCLQIRIDKQLYKKKINIYKYINK